ncbi:MAG: ComEA family DNA-binding protein [Solirubrobacteraceae bacterium]|nr:ComEA family DNA-binding protein [Solirubrobacteraceae bacterium]
MTVDRVLEVAGRWWRPAAVLLVIAVAWLLAAPRGPAPASIALSGPQTGHPAPVASGGLASKPATPRVRRVVVHVAGAVRRPGVYRVRAPGRLIDAVQRAGGLTADADLTQINLAARLTDGRAIIVPRSPATGDGAEPGVGTATGSAPVGKLNANTASAEQLDALDGIGPAMAAAIIALRTKLGGFTRLEQLDDVPGVGEARLASLQAQLEL